MVGLWDSDEEARAVVGRMEALRQGGHAFAEMAVLVRANAQTRAFEERLITVGIPYRVVGGLRFYERQEIRDAIAAGLAQRVVLLRDLVVDHLDLLPGVALQGERGALQFAEFLLVSLLFRAVDLLFQVGDLAAERGIVRARAGVGLLRLRDARVQPGFLALPWFLRAFRPRAGVG